MLDRLSAASAAFRHPVVWDPRCNQAVYANSDLLLDKVPDPRVVGTLVLAEAALEHVLFLTPPTSMAHVAPVTVTRVHRPGDTTPTSLQCWMVSGSRPSLPPDQASRLRFGQSCLSARWIRTVRTRSL